MSEKTDAKEMKSDLLYLPPPPDSETMKQLEAFRAESMSDKFVRKFKENPLIPIGVMGTTLALGVGLYAMQKGKSRLSQKMMRARIAAQGFTIVALLGGVAAATKK